ncbi:MAG: hypothetical protein WC121_09630 [Candidatus Kapaibacterium sp.]
MKNLKKNKPYIFAKHLLNSALALVLVLLPMYWIDYIKLESLYLILGISIAYYPMYRLMVKNRQIVVSKNN